MKIVFTDGDVLLNAKKVDFLYKNSDEVLITLSDNTKEYFKISTIESIAS